MVLGPAYCTAFSAAPRLVRPTLPPQFTSTVAAPTVSANSKRTNGTQTFRRSFRRDMEFSFVKATQERSRLQFEQPQIAALPNRKSPLRMFRVPSNLWIRQFEKQWYPEMLQRTLSTDR